MTCKIEWNKSLEYVNANIHSMQNEISLTLIRSSNIFEAIPLKSITTTAVYYNDLCITFYTLALLSVWKVFSPGSHTENEVTLV